MKQFSHLILSIILSILFVSFTSAQENNEPSSNNVVEHDFSDRQAILKTIENFYIGDHTGSIEHKKLSMHEKGAYRYVNRNGEYAESVFKPESNDSDQNYKEELLSVEIYDKLALARLRLDQFNYELPEYKLMTLHKIKGEWKITSITWGFGITH